METKGILHATFLERLQSVAQKHFGFPPGKKHGLQTRIADALNVDQQRVNAWFDPEKKVLPEITQFVEMKRVFGVPVDYLLGIEEGGKPRLEYAPTPILELANFVEIKETPLRREDFVTVPLVSGTIAATIGLGTIVDEHIEDWAIIHKRVVGKKRSLISIRVDKKDGMSMYPILKAGDIVIIDREDKVEISPAGIYAVRIDDGCTVKRLQQAGHQLLLIPENKEPAYKIRIIDLRQHPEPVIGRVIWCSKTL